MFLDFHCYLVLPNFSSNEIHDVDNLWEKFVVV